VICVDLLFGPFIKSSKTVQSLFQRPTQRDIKPDESSFDAVTHTRRRSQISAVDLIEKSQQLVGERLDFSFSEGIIHALTLRSRQGPSGYFFYDCFHAGRSHVVSDNSVWTSPRFTKALDRDPPFCAKSLKIEVSICIMCATLQLDAS